MSFEYAPAPESKSIVNIEKQYGHFINGKFINGKNHFPTINPATEELLSHIATGDKSDIDKYNNYCILKLDDIEIYLEYFGFF